jgi:hypothetical protein
VKDQDQPDSGAGPEELPLEVDGVGFVLRVFDDPSGLRGQVFHGHEKIAGVQIYHHKDTSRLVEVAQKDAAVRRAVQRINPPA